MEADRGEDLGTVHRSLPLSEYLNALQEEKMAKAAKIAENGGGGGSGGEGSESKKKRGKAKKAEVSKMVIICAGQECGHMKSGRGGGGGQYLLMSRLARPSETNPRSFAFSWKTNPSLGFLWPFRFRHVLNKPVLLSLTSLSSFTCLHSTRSMSLRTAVVCKRWRGSV